MTPGETAVLEAILDRLIPADGNGPGAVEAGVATFVERTLDAETAEVRATYASNLAALDAWAREAHATGFAALSAATRDEMLRLLEQGSVGGFSPSPEVFFELVRTQGIQGMFADPRHGGNAGHAGWDLIGFPGAKGTFTADDQQLDVDVPKVRPDAG
ncbi:MAG TPA: gluconate 2-dehydrogenase subunit 3 family protein [Gaiellaceae bacterium]|jgi:gluconate 2-dehydrogenase gamma chain|nr:gluconate 2-dehydrogenase subunit 3 family protein [Gaiellaceae bacterium]